MKPCDVLGEPGVAGGGLEGLEEAGDKLGEPGVAGGKLGSLEGLRLGGRSQVLRRRGLVEGRRGRVLKILRKRFAFFTLAFKQLIIGNVLVGWNILAKVQLPGCNHLRVGDFPRFGGGWLHAFVINIKLYSSGIYKPMNPLFIM